MGLMEQILAKLDIVIELVKNGHNVEAIAGTVEAIAGTVEATVNDVEIGESVEVDKNGIPWDARIHASSKTKTNAGVWKQRRGVNELEVAKVLAELNAGDSVEEVEEVEETVKKAPPTKKAPPSKTPPTKKAPPSKAAPSSKANCISKIHDLETNHGVDAEHIMMFLDENFGIDTFDAIPADRHGDLQVTLTNWINKLTDIESEISALEKMSADSEHADEITSSIKAFMVEAGGNTHGEVSYAKVHELHKELASFADQWEEYFKD